MRFLFKAAVGVAIIGFGSFILAYLGGSPVIGVYSLIFLGVAGALALAGTIRAAIAAT